MLGGSFYQNYKAHLPAPNPTFIYNGAAVGETELLKNEKYSDPTSVNFRYLSFVGAAADNQEITIRGTIVTGEVITETITLTGTTPVTSVNKFCRILSLNASADVTLLQIGYLGGQTPPIIQNGARSTHFVLQNGTATWTIYALIQGGLENLTTTEIAATRFTLDADLTAKTVTTPDAVYIYDGVGQMWLETSTDTDAEITWYEGVQMFV